MGHTPSKLCTAVFVRIAVRMAVRIAVLIAVLIAAGAVLPAIAQSQEKPPANGRNSRIEFSGTGWVTYRYKVRSEPLRAAALGRYANTFSGDVLPEGANAFDLDRVYFTADYSFNDRYSWQTQFEVNNFGGGGGKNGISVYVKKAFLRVNAPFGARNTAFRVGQIAHVMTPFVEDLWGYRIVSKVPLDRYLGVSTTWLGAAAEGSAAGERLRYDLAVTNQTSYNANVPNPGSPARPGRTKYKTLMGRLSLTPARTATGNVQLSGFAQYAPKSPADSTGLRGARYNYDFWFGGILSARGPRFTAAVEALERRDVGHPAVAGSPSLFRRRVTVSRVISGFGWTAVTAADRVFVRLDFLDPNRTASADGLFVGMGGLSHTFVKGVRGIADLEAAKFQTPRGAHLKTDVTLSARVELSL